MRILIGLIATLSCFAQGSYEMRTVVGSGSRGDGGSARQALLDGPYGLAEDAAGYLYVAESNAGVIRRISPQGVIERFAGTGVLADGAEGAAALQTDLIAPTVLIVDGAGALIFADSKACRIRKVDQDGTVRNVIGTGVCTGSGTGLPGGGGNSNPNRDRRALETQIGTVGGLAIDSSGRLVYSDETNNLVRRLDADGFVRTIAGSGFYGFGGDDGDAVDASFKGPRGLVYDTAGNLYIADGSNCRVRKVDTEGTITTVAGSGTCAAASANFVSGAGTRIAIGRVSALGYDAASEAILIGSPVSARIFRLDIAATRMTSFLGNGSRGAAEEGSAAEFTVDDPVAILPAARNGVLIADRTSFHVIHVSGGQVTTYAGLWPQRDAYTSAASAPLLRPKGLCVQPNGRVLVVDEGSERVIAYQQPEWVSAVVGARYPTGYSSGDQSTALKATLAEPDRVACPSNGEIYISHGRQIRAVSTTGIIRTVLNLLDDPSGIVIDSLGRLVYSEAGGHRVLRYDASTRTKTVIAGTGTQGFSGDGLDATTALLNSPGDLAFDSKGNLLIADRGNRRVRKVDSAGVITTIAGSARSFSYADISGLRATEIGLDPIYGMAVGPDDSIYISEALRVDRVAPDGRIYVLAGLLSEDDAGRRTYRLRQVSDCDGIAVDTDGRVYVSERGAGRVIVLEPTGLAGRAVVTSTAFGGYPQIAPGSWIEIYGVGLSDSTRTWSDADFRNGVAPSALDNVEVSVDGVAASLSYVSPGQINAQVPTGIGTGVRPIVVRNGGSAVMTLPVIVNAIQPGLLAPTSFRSGDVQYVTAVLPDGVLSSSRPARRGETVILYGVGFGAVDPVTGAGQAAAGPNAVVESMEFYVGLAKATVSYAGLTPGAIGLYQFNVVIPETARGTVPLSYQIGGRAGGQNLFLAVEE